MLLKILIIQNISKQQQQLVVRAVAAACANIKFKYSMLYKKLNNSSMDWLADSMAGFFFKCLCIYAWSFGWLFGKQKLKQSGCNTLAFYKNPTTNTLHTVSQNV